MAQASVAESRVLVVGGYGEAGRRIARRLAPRRDLVLAVGARDRRRVEQAAAELTTVAARPVHATVVDTADAASVRAALAGVRLLVNAAPAAALTPALVDAVLEARADWVDLQLSSPDTLRSNRARIERAGCCFITQAGFHPGLPGVLIRWAGARFDRMSHAIAAGLLRQRGGLPWTPAVDELVAAMRDGPARVFDNGRWRQVGGRNYPVVEFAFGMGHHRCYPMEMEEVRALPERLPSLRTAAMVIAGFDPVTDYVTTPILLMGTRVLGPRGDRPLGKLLCWSTRRFNRPPYGVVLQVDAAGTQAGAWRRLRLAVAHADAYDLTAIPVVALINQLLDPTLRRPGLHVMGLFAEPDPLVDDLPRMGAAVSETTETVRRRAV